MLEIKNLTASINDTPILTGLNLTVKAGEVHAIMGPNGSGKSTLSKVVSGHPAYEVTGGTITFNGEDVLEMDPDERALKGVFLAFQYPVEIPGVHNAHFLRMAYNSKRKFLNQPELDPLEFEELLQAKLNLVEMDAEFLDRSVNHGFSGGEKKRNEILQLLVLDPTLTFLDETDSGLDIDALRVIAQAINVFKSPQKAIVMITHYQRLLNYIVPDIVHVMSEGKIVKSGDKSLALELEEKGYEWVRA
jgi:Fe-S cluster assembly ATP-binding protein